MSAAHQTLAFSLVFAGRPAAASPQIPKFHKRLSAAAKPSTLRPLGMPPPSGSAGAGAGAGADDLCAPSGSAIVGATVTARHLLDIACYSRTKEELPTGKSIKSRSFTLRAGGSSSSWHIGYFPNSDRSDTADFISIFLYLDKSAAEPVKARARFSLLDQAGKQVPSHSRSTSVRDFSTATPAFGLREFIDKAWLEQSGHLRNDRVTIRCDVIVNEDLRAEEWRPPSPLVVVPPSNLQRNFSDLLDSKEGADVTFQVAGETFQAQRCVLAARSPVFKAEVFGAMKESTKGAVIRVDDIDAEVFRALLSFVYTDTLQDAPDMKKQEAAAMAQHLLVAADRYNLERLKLICEDKLCRHIDTASAATILALAEQHNCGGLKKACFRFLSSPLTLNAVMATDGFDHLARSCPFVLKELMSTIAARVPLDRKEAS